MLIHGPETDVPMLHQLIEDVRATVVADDTFAPFSILR